MNGISVFEITGTHEECLKAFFGTGDDGCVISEKQSTQYGYEHDGEKVGFAALLIVCHCIFEFIIYRK